MTLPILPTPPTRTDPANFSVRADDWVAALTPWTTAANAMEASLQTSNLVGTSTTSLAVGTGSKGFTTQAGKAWIVGSYVFIVATSDRSRVMQGKVTSYNSGTGSLVVDVNIASGSGTYTSWDIGIANPSIGATSGFNAAGDLQMTASDPALRFINGDSQEIYIQCLKAANGGRALRIFDSAAGQERLRINSAGGVGLGIDTTYKLGVGGAVELQHVTGQGTVSNYNHPLIYSTESSGSFGFNGHLVLQPRGSAAGAVIIATGNGVGAMTERLRVDASGNVLISSPATLGYGTGAGNTRTQSTSKATTVDFTTGTGVLNPPSGQITMHGASLAANTTVSFIVSNTRVLTTDNIIVNLKGGYASYGTYDVKAEGIGAGSFVITLKNISGGSLSEAVVLTFSVIRGSTT